MKNAKTKAYQQGMRAEKLAALYLLLRGFKIIALRYKTPMGEIDLIALRGKTLVFVEVKTRAGMDDALYAVTQQGRGRIERAAQYFIAAQPRYRFYDMRFDVVAIRLRGWIPLGFRHLDNAWQAGS
jgi:putative endonuclease